MFFWSLAATPKHHLNPKLLSVPQPQGDFYQLGNAAQHGSYIKAFSVESFVVPKRQIAANERCNPN